jgi:predicted metal-dependent hydrolase
MLKNLQLPVTPPSVEQRTLELAGTSVTFTLKRTNRRRSIGLRIDDRGLTVTVPLRASEKWLLSVLREKAQWIVEMLKGWNVNKPGAPHWVDGEIIPFVGESLSLRVVASLFDAPPLLHGRQLFVHVTDCTSQVVVEQMVTQWQQHQAEVLFKQRVAHFSALMNVTPRAVRLSSARTQWGCCTAHGNVRLNWRLVRLSLRLIDYVVVHELAHLVELNHSAAFWQVVKSVCPDFARRRAELRQHPC